MYSKDFKAKNRDVIEHYLEQEGPVCNTQRNEQDAMPCNTSLSYKKCLFKFWANNLIIFKTSLCMGAEPSMEMSRLTRGGTAEPVSRDQILRHARGQGNINFSCSADHEQDWQLYPVDPYSATYVMTIHTYI